MNTPAAPSLLHPVIARYLQLQRALGKGFDRERRILESLDHWLTKTGSVDLDAEHFTAWCKNQQHLTSGVRRNHMRVVRNFCLYRRRSEPTCFVPDLRSFPANHQTLPPYVFTEGQIARLIQTADRLEPVPLSPLRPHLYRLAIVLLYTTGLRRGELLRLSIGDYDPRQQTLLVRPSKFHKSRHLPLSHDTAEEIATYLGLRRHHHLPLAPETPLIWNRGQHGKAYSGGGLGQGLRALFRQAEIRTSEGRLPRTHDIRHSFAVNALLRWYRLGADIHAKLPLLATYMGHVSIVSTELYLHFVEELAAHASDRFNAHYGDVVLPLPKGQGGEP
jgi:integrase/recombinase XerD